MLDKIRKGKERIFTLQKVDRYVIYLFVVIVIISLILYFPYLTFKKLYVFNDIGSDTFDSYWPIYSFFVDWIKGGGGLWSFNIGLGTSVLTLSTLFFDPFNIILLLSTRENLVYFIPYIVISKMILSGILFFYYLKYIKISSKVSFLMSIIYTFNGYIVLWGQHYHFVSIFVYAPLVLWGYERLWKQNKWGMFTISIGLVAVNSYYFLYMISIFLFIYAITRYFAENKFHLKDAVRLFFKTSFFYLIGVGIFMVLIAPSMYIALSNPRVSRNFSSINLFKMASPLEYMTMIARAFSNDMMGMAFNYKGWFNYYEAPQLYCGLIVMILVPQIIKLNDIRKKVSYCVSFFFWLFLLVYPNGSYFMNFFSDYKFRWTFIIIVYGIILSAIVLNDVIAEGIFSKRLHIATFFVLLLLFVVLNIKKLKLFNINLFSPLYEGVGFLFPIFAVLFFLCFYFILFLIQGRIQKRCFFTILSCVICFEMIVLNFFSINVARSSLNTDYVKSKQGYFDKTNDAIEYIKENDKSFYRIDKSYFSRFLNDPLIQDYRGTSAYNSLNHPSYIKFLEYTNTADFTNSSKNYIRGLNGRPYLENLVGVKYYLGLKEEDCPTGFSLLKCVNDIMIFKNDYSLPFGFTYEQYIDSKSYKEIEGASADLTMLSTVVVEEDTIPKISNVLKKANLSNLGIEDHRSIAIDVDKVSTYNLDGISGTLPDRLAFVSTSNDPMVLLPLLDKVSGGVMKVKLTIESSAPGVGQIFWGNDENDFTEAKSTVFNFSQQEAEYEINLGNVSPSILRLDIGNSAGLNVTIKNLDIQYQYQNMVEYKRIIDERSKEHLEITHFSDTEIIGNINLEKNKLMFISIPYDEGWKVYVDNKEVKAYKVNMGFIGILLEKGYHSIKLDYKAPWLDVGLIVSIISIFIIAGIIIWNISNGSKKVIM